MQEIKINLYVFCYDFLLMYEFICDYSSGLGILFQKGAEFGNYVVVVRHDKVALAHNRS